MLEVFLPLSCLHKSNKYSVKRLTRRLSEDLTTLTCDILLAVKWEPLMPRRLEQNLHLHITAPFSDIA